MNEDAADGTNADGEPLPDALFERADTAEDAHFYQQARLVTHIDDATIGALTDWYRDRLPAGGDLLDLMSSWISHLPDDVRYGRIEGLGMNAEELAANPRLDAYQVHDLNLDPVLSYPDDAFDAVMIVVSIQYLIQPVAVFTEIERVLRPGGQLVVAMSHRMFPTKAIRAFHALGTEDRIRLVMEYCRRAGFAGAAFEDASPDGADPLWLVVAHAA